MSAFRRTLRVLNEDGWRRWRRPIAFVIALLIAWSMWTIFAQVPIYTTSQSARIELDSAVFPVEALVGGRVISSNLALGRRVGAGEVLLEIDTTPFVLDLHELEAKQASVLSQIAALHRQLGEERAAVTEAAAVSRAAAGEGEAHWREANTAARLAAQESDRATRLHASGLIGDADLLRLRAEADKRESAARGFRLSTERQHADDSLKQKERLAQCESLERDLASLDGERNSLRVAIARAAVEIDRRQIRAPASGVIADVSTMRPGAVIREGDRLATLATQGHLQVVASFAPDAVGRLKSGQRGRLRLAGYPWQQYGALPVIVERVASELRDSRVRVELRLPSPAPGIPLQHALPGAVEIETDRISPAALLLRNVGWGARASS